MKTSNQSITGMALTMAVSSALALTITPASAQLTVHVNFDYTVSNRTDLVGPAGGAGETWNQTMLGGHNVAGGFSGVDVADSENNATGIDWTMQDKANPATVGLFRWVSSEEATLNMLDHGIFHNRSAVTLTISDLNPAKTYDLYITGYGGSFGNQTNSSTSNTATTSSPQNMLQSGETTSWVLNDNYILFEDVVPDISGDIAVDSTKVSSYGFWSGFQLVEGAGDPGDSDPPTPDPMEWAVAGKPAATGETSITMTATTATDPGGVLYLFTNDTWGDDTHDSGWQVNPTYTDTGLVAGTSYSYTVRARDANENTTAPSPTASASTDPPDATAPTPNPMTWLSVPAATGAGSITMTASTATDPGGVEYYFTNETWVDDTHDSGWQTSPTYTDIGLLSDTSYSYTVMARDGNENTTDPSAPTASATTNPASAGTVWNYNFDIDIHNRTDLFGPAGGAGETWGQAMQGTNNGPGGFWDNDIPDSEGNPTAVDWTMQSSNATGSLFRWNGSDVATLSTLKRGIFLNTTSLTLTITALDPLKTYDLYITGYTTGYTNKTTNSTSNTTTTSNPQVMEMVGAPGESASWVLNDNYIVFEDMVPDGSGNLVVNSVKNSSYGFYSGFQLVETSPPVFLITNFSYDATGGSSEVRIEGEPGTRYKLVEAADLDFANPDQDPVLLSRATVGTLNGDGVVTDSNGDATVQFNLGTIKSATYLRAEEFPVGDGAELDLLTAVRGGYSRKVVIIGTSLSHPTYGDWPALMTPWLKGEAPDPTKVTVVNLAQSGSSSQTGGINKLASVKAENPDTVFMEFSMNDCYVPYEMSQAQSEANHNFIINDLQADNPDIEIIIQTMNNPEGSGLGPRPDIAAYYQVARDVATAQGVLLIDHNVNWLALFNTDQPTWNTYVADGVHPSSAGYTAIMIPELQATLEAAAAAP